MRTFRESAKELPTRETDVIVAGGGTAGVFAATAAARSGARTTLIESKGYVGGTAVEGGTALHSFYNLYQAFNVEKKQLVKGIPQEFIDRLIAAGGCSGHAEMSVGYDYDAVATVIDTEIYKLVAFEMLAEAGVEILVNTLLTNTIMDNSTIQGVLTESHAGREAILAKSFVDCTGYGDLAARAGAEFIELNDHPVANSIGMGGVNIDRYHDYLQSLGAVSQRAEGWRGGKPGQIVRVDADWNQLPADFVTRAREIGMSFVTTTLQHDSFLFIKLNYKMDTSPTDRDAVALAEIELRRRQQKAVELFREFVPGCENAYITRTSPSLNIRRGRTIVCDYDITLEDIVEGRHFEDDILAYGFHDEAPRIQIKNGGSYGIPYRALLPKEISNLYCTGMMITTDWHAHMSTRNTVSCMGQGQAAGTAAALCASQHCSSRDLSYDDLRLALLKDNVVFVN